MELTLYKLYIFSKTDKRVSLKIIFKYRTIFIYSYISICIYKHVEYKQMIIINKYNCLNKNKMVEYIPVLSDLLQDMCL